MSAVTFARADTLGRRSTRWRRPGNAALAFALVLALGFALILIETRGLSFAGDEWDFLLDRRGISARVLLTPHGPHLSLFPILVYKVLLQVFGASTYLPFRILAAVDLAGLGLVLGVICRRIWGPWWGLAPVLLLVTLGPGAVSLLSPFQVGYALALGGGLLAFVTLRWRSDRGDALACLCLLISLGSSSQGVGFVVGVAVYLGLRGDLRRKSWVVLIPAILYVLWYLKYGHQASESQFSLWNTALLYTVQGLGATISGLLALTTVSPQTGLLDPTLGEPLLFGGLATLAFAWSRGWRPTQLFWVAVSTTLVLWIATALSNTPAVPRLPDDPRYLSSNGVLLLICVCAAVPRPRWRRGGVTITCLALAVIALTNVSQFAPARTSLSSIMVYSRAETGALLVMRGVVAPNFTPSYAGDPADVPTVTAGAFFSAADAFGDMDGDSVPALEHAPEAVREVVDQELQRGEQIGLVSAPAAGASPSQPPTALLGTARQRGGCLAQSSPSLIIRAGPGQYTFTAPGRTRLTIAMARFASFNSVSLGLVGPGQSETLHIPADRAPGLPWRIDIAGPGGRICQSAG